MTSLFISILFGAVAYALVQFLWYSAPLFGPMWCKECGLPKEALHQAAFEPGRTMRVMIGIVLPSFLTSMALVTLFAVLARAGLGQRESVTWALILPVLVAAPKYLRSLFFWRRLETLVMIQDGALIIGAWAASGAIILSQW